MLPCRQRPFVKAPDGVEICRLHRRTEQGGNRQRKNGDDQQGRQYDLHGSGLFDTDDVEDAEEHQNRHGEDHLAKPDLKTGHRIMEAELEDIGCAVQTIDDQADGRRVHGNIGQIGRHQKPAAAEGCPAAEAGICEGILTTGSGVFGHHIGVAAGDDDHDGCAQHHGDGRTGYA